MHCSEELIISEDQNKISQSTGCGVFNHAASWSIKLERAATVHKNQTWMLS